MSDETATPTAGAPVGNDTATTDNHRRNGYGDGAADTLLPSLSQRERAAPSPNDVSKLTCGLREVQGDCSTDEPSDAPWLEVNATTSAIQTELQVADVSASIKSPQTRYAHSIPPKTPRGEPQFGQIDDTIHHHHLHHHHHHHSMRTAPNGGDGSQSARTNPEIPSLLRTSPTKAQLLLAATVGILVAALIALLHSHSPAAAFGGKRHIDIVAPKMSAPTSPATVGGASPERTQMRIIDPFALRSIKKP